MSIGEGHGSAVRVEINPGPSLEVDLGPVLEVGPGIEQEPEVKAITALTPRMSIPTPWPTTRNPSNKRVSFCIPGGKELVMDRGDSPTEPSINDLELWLECQAEQLGTPMWWGELEAVLGITDPHVDLPGKSMHPSTYWKSNPGCPQVRSILHLWLPEV